LELWTRVRSALGMAVASMGGPTSTVLLAAEPKSESLITEYIGDPAISEQFTQVGGNLTPARVASIIAMADRGYISQFVDLTHESRQKDGHFQSIMQSRELAVLGLPWGLALDKPSTEESTAMAACEASLSGCATFPGLMAHLNGESLLFGHSTSEGIYRIGDDFDNPLLRGLLIHDKFKNMSCNRFGFRNEDGALLFDAEGRGDVNQGGIDLLATYPAGKFVQQRRRVNGDVAIREGLGRVLVWFSLFRNWTLRDWLQLAEMAFKPWRIGEYDKERTTGADRDILWRVLKRLTTAGVAVLPDSTKLKVEWPQAQGVGQQSVHRELAEYMGQEMSKAVLGGTLTNEAGNRGARALGNVHERVARQLRNADVLEISATVQAHVVNPFYRYNYGTKYRVPTFYINTDEVADVFKFCSALAKLTEAGDEEIPVAWVHDKIGIPSLVGGESVLRPPTANSNVNEQNQDGNGNEGDGEE